MKDLTPAQIKLIGWMRSYHADNVLWRNGYCPAGREVRSMQALKRLGLVVYRRTGWWLVETLDAQHAEALGVAANQDQGRAWALRHLNGQCDSRGTCQPVPASAERPANPDFFEWVGALWCDEREAYSKKSHRWYQDKRINDRGPDVIACNCTQSDGKDHVFTPSCMWDDDPAVSISAGDYGQPVGPKCTRHTNQAAMPTVAPDRPLHPRISGMFGTNVHAAHVDPALKHATLCGASKRLADHAELTTDDIDCPVCLRMTATPTGATVRELAAFADTEIHELRAFADDMLDGLGDDDAMTSETERTLREALAQQAALGESFVPDPSLVFEIKVVDRLAPAAAPVVAALDRLATRAAMAAARAALVKAVMFEEVYSRLPLADAETLAHAEREQRWYDALALGFAPIRSDRQIAL